MKITIVLLLTIISTSSFAKLRFPLKIDPVSSYECLFNNGADSSLQQKYSYYFTSRTYPLPLDDTTYVACHDKTLYGETDSVFIPRLNQQDRVFKLWDKYDPAFIDSDNNGIIDIHDYIQNSLGTNHIHIFESLRLLNSTTGRTQRTKEMGYLMRPFINNNLPNRDLICPTIYDYSSGDQLMRIIGQIVRTDTEAIYRSEEVKRNFEIKDILIQTHSALSRIWFHVENGRHIIPTRQSMRWGKPTYFYWPADRQQPHVRKAHQKIYKLVLQPQGQYIMGCVPRT